MNNNGDYTEKKVHKLICIACSYQFNVAYSRSCSIRAYYCTTTQLHISMAVVQLRMVSLKNSIALFALPRPQKQHPPSDECVHGSVLGDGVVVTLIVVA